MKILVTGSHFTPAQATIEQLQNRFQAEVIYVGRASTREGDNTPSLESQVLPKLGVRFIPITAGRLQRTLTIHTIPSLLKIPVGFFQALQILTNNKPDVVLSFGGYVAVPVVICAWLLSIPVIIHEQTLVTGLANKISSLFAKKIAVSFKDTKFNFPKNKMIVTGNPLRSEIIGAKPKKYKLPVILITTGNQGSHVINQTVGQAIGSLTEEFTVIHQTGESSFKDYEVLDKIKDSLKFGDRYILHKYLSAKEMGEAMSSAFLAVVRAGANTLIELAYLQTPAVIIPIKDHYEQSINAKYFEQKGLGVCLLQKDLTADNLLKVIKGLKLKNPNLNNPDLFASRDAAARLALETVLLKR